MTAISNLLFYYFFSPRGCIKVIFKGNLFNTKEKIELLQRWIIVHSYLYYILDSPIIDDHVFDSNCKQLVELKIDHPIVWGDARYSYAMGNFDGCTGMGLVENLKDKELTSVHRDVGILTSKYYGKTLSGMS